MKYEIGKEITFKNDFKIETHLSNTVMQIRKGDKAVVMKNGLRILNGEGRGKIVAFNKGDKAEGYDVENISKMILNRLNVVFNLEEFFENEEIDPDRFAEEIEDVLYDLF